MRAYDIYTKNLETIKQYLRDVKQGESWAGVLILNLGNDTVRISQDIKTGENERILATQDVESIEAIRQSIIFYLWEQAEQEDTKAKMQEFADNAPSFDIDDDEEFESLEDE